jgi:hypothetical protein
MQGADLVHVITFDPEFDVDNYTWSAKIAKDRDATSFTYDGSSATQVVLTVDKVDDQNLNIVLTGAQTAKFSDGFEGVWDLVSKANSGSAKVRQIEGDVLVSSGVVQTSTDTFSAAS